MRSLVLMSSYSFLTAWLKEVLLDGLVGEG